MILLVALFVLSLPLAAQDSAPTARKIIERVERNYRAQNRVVVSKMIIHARRGTRTVLSRSWIVGTEKAFTEYLAPARERGTKMLKLGDQLWTYSPSTDRIIRIAGHMLRQSVMGSDLSYEDFMEDDQLQEAYSPEIVGEDTLAGRPCWVLELVAKKRGMAYYSRKVWIDRERYLPLREERYARSGKLLKTTEVKEVMQVDSRWVAKHVIFKDVLKTGRGTEFLVESIQFDVDIPEYLFSRAALRR